MIICRESKFHMAHRLLEHKGKCFHLHGHTYRLLVYVVGSVGVNSGMVLDFSDLDRRINSVVDMLDHAVMVSDRDISLRQALKILDTRFVPIEGESTAENIVIWLWSNIKGRLVNSNTVLDRLVLFETDKSSVIYRGEHEFGELGS